MFVSAGTNLRFHYWPLEVSQDVFYKPQGSGNITATSLSKDNSFLTFVSENGIPEIISLKDPEKIKNVHTVSVVTDVSTIAFQRTTKRCIGLATNSGQVALYDTKKKFISKLLQSAPGSVNLLDFNVGDEQMAISCVNGTILLYDFKRGNVCETYAVFNTHSPSSMVYHPTEKHILAVGVTNGNVLQWDTNAGVTKFCGQIHNASITGLVLLQNSDLMLSVGSDHKFCIHDSNHECIFRSNQQNALTAVSVSSDGVNVAVGSVAGDISVYDMRKLIKPLLTWKAHNTKINKILFEHKIKYDLNDICVEPSAASRKHHEFIATQDTKSKEPKMIKTEILSDLKFLCDPKHSSEKEFKYVPDKSQSTSDKKSQNETISMKSIKHDVLDSIHRSANELQNHLLAQFGSLHNFVTNEFRTMDNQMEEKWDFLNIAKYASSRETHTQDKGLME